MKKLFSLLILICLLSLCPFFVPKQASAANDILCGFCPELCGGTSGSNISSGEYFKCQPLGNNSFKLCKNSGCYPYEQFRYDSTYIYHVYDVPWSDESGDVLCHGSNKLAAGVRFDSGSDTPGIKWVNQSMSVGSTQTSPGRVIGEPVESLGSGQYCETDHSGDMVHGMLFAYRGCVIFPTGVVSLDTLEFHIVSGGGVGEQFFYNMSKQKGWVGFNRGTPDSGAYVTDPIDTLPEGVTCKEITIEPGTPGPGASEVPSECNLNDPGDRTSRPVTCQACNQTGKMISDCATSFTVSDEVEFQRKDGFLCTDGSGNTWWVDNHWGGNIVVDATKTIIPFVGKKGEESEALYLADYYEGTNLYYDAICKITDTECQRKVIMEGGVWRKIASPQLQDLFKRKMCKRVMDSKNGSLVEGAVRDYLVFHEKPDGTKFSDRVSEINKHQPPFPNEDDYLAKYEAWKLSDNGKWYYLWAAMPMFSREDTIGSVVPYLGRNQLDKFTIQDPDKSTIERVPHVARLYEATSAINQVLLPTMFQANNGFSLSANSKTTNKSLAKQNTTDPKSTPKLLASNKVLLAQEACRNCAIPNIIDPHYENGAIHYTLQVCPSCPEKGTIGDVSMGPCGARSQVQSVWSTCMSSDNTAIAPPVPISCPGTALICSEIKADRDVDSSCAGQVIATVCNVTVDASCNIIDSTCGAAPPANMCGPLPILVNVPKCEKPADTGNGDPICCGPINIVLDAVDRIENKEHLACDPIAYPFGGDPCYDTVGPFDVNRKIGVALSHPYLEQIWQNTAEISTGFLNIFKLAGVKPFEDVEAKSTIRYSGVSVSPSTGNFYYPHLRGQRAKQYVINELTKYTESQ